MGSVEARRRVCLFGLSADPPTGRGGHIGIVTYLSELDEFGEHFFNFQGCWFFQVCTMVRTYAYSPAVHDGV